MIGQTRLLSAIDDAKWQTPRFTILSGGRGAGKRMIAQHIANREQMQLINCGIKVEDVREVITLSHKLAGGALFLFPNADHMSPAARNALLKVTEEAPRQSHFMMTVYDSNQVMATLQSRAFILQLDPYTSVELCEYATSNYPAVDLPDEEIMQVCMTPGDVDILINTDPQGFYDYVKLVVESLRDVLPANALKIGKQIAFKSEDEGWDLTLFLRMFTILCANGAGGVDTMTAYEAIRNTTQFLGEMNINGINKAATFDMWLLDMMEVFGNDPTC